MRHLVLVLGDQLTHDSAAFDGFDAKWDQVWMAEVEEEATHVWCHKLRLALFFSAMRHFRDELIERGTTVSYQELTVDRRKDRGSTFSRVLERDVARLKPSRLIITMPGDYRVLAGLKQTAADLGMELEVRPDRHFYCSPDEFCAFAKGRKTLLMETFYRQMRTTHGVLMTEQGKPVGGAWNFDRLNRESLKDDKPRIVPPPVFPPDAVTSQVIAMVEQRYASHPGRLDRFTLPVTRTDARRMLRQFIEKRLAGFGPFEDAMRTDDPWLYHSRLSTSLNLKLLDPRECVTAAATAYERGQAPIQSVEGFIRQILGWREFVHGLYWLHMPDYREKNHLGHELDLPAFYWDGETDMNCLRHTLQAVLQDGYTHHIQRLMVAGLFALLFGVHPRTFHEWHMAMYLDAVDWVSLPNALGMSQYGDGGIVGTKPYCASGNYINKMSNYCGDCRYDYRKKAGDDACPFTTLYYDFLDRHGTRFAGNPRMAYQLRNLRAVARKPETLKAIRTRAQTLRRQWAKGSS